MTEVGTGSAIRAGTIEIVRARVQTKYHGLTIVTEALCRDGAIWSVRVTVRQDAENETRVIKKLELGGSVTFRTSTGAARAGMLIGREWIERRDLPMTFVIVDRNQPEVAKALAKRFADDPAVRIIFDRRIRLGESPAGERRWDAEGSASVLRAKGYIIIRTE